ncbi:hypothetical protein PAECIP112173_02366 [Paenibacillus sp. JJ-100]|uniref:hypothetical protein n=1 Tax=Paenibacillus sp. JJ-100 TaxID=2974896 RepID=UPI0022FF6316|nr:hypothetical protein [Paenibacillus sp. JJ-100]CAI6075250.1 hypothetical protein PAECIP112173_02366 [Paenibacillus sp. JJ-100]
MRFHWIKPTSRACFIAGVVTRVHIGKMTMDQAIDFTLSLERQCKNPHLISKRELQSLKRDSDAELIRIRKSTGAVPAAGGR